MKLLMGLVLVITVALLGAALAHAQEPVVITEAQAGQEVEVQVGDAVDVVLRGNASTGYAWQLDPTGLVVAVPSGQPDYSADRAIPGSPGTYRFHFTIVAVGVNDLNFTYRRPWEKESAGEGRFSVTLKATEAVEEIPDESAGEAIEAE